MVSTRRKGWGRSLVMGLISGCSAGSLLWPSLGHAQIVPDRTLGTQVNSSTTLSCTGFCQITSGSQRSSNLFHSFQQFSLPNGDTADFVVDPTIQNVIVRVTGTNASNINGLIATTDQAFTQVIPTNFFLLNPNGIIFGPNARIFVGGAFLASTAERMLFQDGTVFDTHDQTVAPLLTVSVPVGLQMGATPGNIQMRRDVQQSSRLDTSPTGNSQFTSFTLVGGDISLNSSTISVPGQPVELAALAGGGSVELQQTGNILKLGSLGNSARANVTLTNQSRIGVAATNNSSGSISIYGQDVALTETSTLAAGILSGIQSGDVIVDATGPVTLMDSSGIINGVLGIGNSGSISVSGQQVELINGSTVGSFSAGTGDVGKVTIKATESITLAGRNAQGNASGITSSIASLGGFSGNGDGGDIFLKAPTVTLQDGAQIFSSNILAQGNAGNIRVEAPAQLKLTDNSSIQATTFGSGNAGSIELTVGNLEMTGRSQVSTSTYANGNAGRVKVDATAVGLYTSSSISSNVENGAVGNGSDIEINSGSLAVTNGAQIQTIVRGVAVAPDGKTLFPAGKGNAGTIQINVQGSTTISGIGISSTNGLSNTLPSQIASTLGFGASGQAGNITLTTGSLSITDGGILTSSTFGQGNAKNITVNARGDILIQGSENGFGSGIFSTVEYGSHGNAGDIEIRGKNLTVTEGGQIQTLVREPLFATNETILFPGGQGSAGNIRVYVEGDVRLDGTTPVSPQVNSTFQFFPSRLQSSLGFGATGHAGDILVQADSLSLTNGAQVLSGTSGTGDAGNILIDTRQATTIDGFTTVVAPNGSPGFALSGVLSTVEFGGKGNGGDIRIKSGSLSVTNYAQVQTINRAGQGNAGNIILETQDTALLNNFGTITSAINFGAVGNGENINVQAKYLSLDNFSQINSNSYGQGNAGNLSIHVLDNIFLNNQSQISATVGVGGNGKAGDIDIQGRSLKTTGGAQIGSTLGRTQFGLSGGKGQGGDIRVNMADSVTLSGSSVLGFSSGILTLSERGASGDAGNVAVNTGDLRITDGALIVASTFNNGNAGNIVVNANTVEAINGGQIVTDTRSSGRAGNITLNAKDSLLLAGSDPNSGDRLNRINQYLKLPGNTDQLTDVIANVGGTSGLFANTEANSSGSGGSISITSPRITIQDGAGTFVNSQGSGQGGNIQIQSGRVSLDNKGTISAETASAQGGNITLDLRNILLLRHNSLISTTAGTAQAGGNGGNITIKAPFIIGILSENSDITANAFTGSGGNIDITTNGIYGLKFQPKLTPFSDITASSQFGLNGTVILNLLNVDPSRSLTQLPENLIDTNRILANSCLVRDKSSGGVFLVTGTGGLPEQPDNTLPMFPTGTVRALPDASPAPRTVQPTNDYITEAQGIYRLPDGQVILSWECNEK